MVPVGTICVATGQAGAEIGADMAPTLNCNHEAPYVAHSLRGEGFDASEDRTDCLRAFEKSPFAVQQMGWQVRRLTPEECEALQGFSRGYTNVPHRNKPAADGPRYKALGNSWAVPCARWIGERIESVEALSRTEQRVAA